VEWLSSQSPTCPLTRKPMKVSDFVSNNRLRNEILEWRRLQGEDVTSVTLSESSIIHEEITRALTAFGNSKDCIPCARRQKGTSILRLLRIRQ
jgi:U-box domain